MSKEILGIILAVVVGVVGFALWLADKYGKATSTLTFMVLLVMAGLCLCLVYLIPWLWNAETMAEKIWRPSSATALVLIAVGYFGVWVSRPHINEPKEKAIASTAQLDAPELVFSFKQIVSGASKPPLPAGTMIIVIGDLANKGKMPSNAREWNLKIRPAGEQKETDGTLIGGNFKNLFIEGKQGQKEQLSWEKDYLPEIMARKTLAWGETVPGFIVFVARSAKFDNVKRKGTAYEFRFEDVTEKKYAFTYIGKGGSQPALYLPGLSIPPENGGQDKSYSPDSLSQMAPLELRFRTQEFCAKVRGLGKKWNSEYNKNNQEWLDATKSAKSQEEKESLDAKRMADNERSLRLLRDEFNKEYLRDAQSLKTVLLGRVSKIVIRGGGPSTGPGYSEPPLPMVPPLLEFGSTAGSNPFNDVAEYLDNLAGRLY